MKVIVGGNLLIKKAPKIFLLNCSLLLMRINADKKVGYVVFRQCRFRFSVLPRENDLGTAQHRTIKFTSPLVFSGGTYFISDCFELEFERKNRQSTVLVFTDEMDNF